jgi:translation initiation factor IF-2
VCLQGKLASLRRVKDDVKEVAAGTECGIAVDGFKDWEVSMRHVGAKSESGS